MLALHPRHPPGMIHYPRKSGVTLEKARELVKQLLAEEQTISPSNPEQHEQS